MLLSVFPNVLLPCPSPPLQVDDEDLQDEPLQITVLDHDTYSANDAIGKVYIDIDPLLCNEAASVISGWFPIYDTIHGTRICLSVHAKHSVVASYYVLTFICFFFKVSEERLTSSSKWSSLMI